MKKAQKADPNFAKYYKGVNIMKTRRFLSFVLVAVILTAILSLFSIGVAADDVWDGVTADMSWLLRDKNAKSFEIRNAEELYGYSIYIAAAQKGTSITQDGAIYIDKNNKAILDPNKLTDAVDVVFGTEQWAQNGYSVKLMADIDLGGHVFLPLGHSHGLLANFDGNGKTVKNFRIDDAGAKHIYHTKQRYYGFIGYNCGEVKNLNLKNMIIDVTPSSDANLILVGGVAATALGSTNSALINCTVDGLTINYEPAGTLQGTPMIGAALGRVECGAENSVTVTNFKFNDKTNGSIAYSMDQSKLFGAAGADTITPKFSATSKVTTGTGADLPDAPATEAPSTSAPETNAPTTNAPTTNAPTTNAPDTKAPTTTKAPSTTKAPANAGDTTAKTTTAATSAPAADAPADNNMTVIIIAGVAVAVVVAVVVIIIVKKKKN